MNQINHQNVVRITKGFMKNYLIPIYKLLAPYQNLALKSLSSTSDYIYGKHLEVNGQHVKDIWNTLPILQPGLCKFDNPNEHQERLFAKGTYNSLCSMTISVPANCTIFEDLYDYVYNTFFASKFPKAYLTSYDMAYRIGYNLSPQILPKDFVYLAAGAYLGVKCLFGEDWISKNEDSGFHQKIAGKFARVKRNKFYYTNKGKHIDYFNGLSSAEVEDMLCIFFDV